MHQGATERLVLSLDQINELRQFSSPTIANAVETFHVRPRQEGVSDSRIRCIFPSLGVVVGYAFTAAILSGQPAPELRKVNRREYWRYVGSFSGPKIGVVQDLSPEPGGAYWGEVNSSLHKALGSQGVITNGTVRDLDEVERIGFHFSHRECRDRMATRTLKISTGRFKFSGCSSDRAICYMRTSMAPL
jgi:regulator of RNase E activity RraA